MIAFIKDLSQTLKQPPGTVVHIGDKTNVPVKITVFDYDAGGLEEQELSSIEACFELRDKPSVSWINIDGLHDLRVFEKMHAHFGIHPLVGEDIVNTEQRPKIEDYGDYLFIVVKMMYRPPDSEDIVAEQVSLLVGKNYVLSFQERPGDVFDEIRSRIRQGKGRIRQLGPDYLAYCLLDAIVDNCFSVLEWFSDRVEDLEARLLQEVEPGMAQEIHRWKRNTVLLRKQIWPLREVVSGMQRSGSKLIQKSTDIFLRDLYDHTIQIIDTIESIRDILGGLHDVHLTVVSNRMNEIMKVLTIFASIFIPLTFIAGIYGMNFQNMPELQWRYGYFAVLAFMFLLGISLLSYFKRKNWL